MSEHVAELKRRLIVGHKRDGRACYDWQAKQELIAAGLRPGVSVARLALEHGINANLLRTWIRKHLDRQDLLHHSGMPTVAPSAFVPVVPVAMGSRSRGACSELAVRLSDVFLVTDMDMPNGVRVECASLGADQLSQLLQLLHALPCSASTPD